MHVLWHVSSNRSRISPKIFEGSILGFDSEARSALALILGGMVGRAVLTARRVKIRL